MSVHQHPSRAIRSGPSQRTPRNTVAQLILRGVRCWQRNRAINELGRLNDSQLADIGISRNDIPHVVAELFGPRHGPAAGSPNTQVDESIKKAA